jgi:N-methylhydantoinase B/oxoprolinase/acetone carboxylase alpha subunit
VGVAGFVWSACLGGWGDPHNRTRARVLADVKEGYISERAALETYGQTP